MAKKIYGSSTSSLLNKIAAEQEQATAPTEQEEQPAEQEEQPAYMSLEPQVPLINKKKTACYSVDEGLAAAIDYIAFYDGSSISDVVANALQLYASAWDYKTKSKDGQIGAEYKRHLEIALAKKERGRKK